MADSSIRKSSSFVRLYCSNSKLSATAAMPEKQGILTLSELEFVIIQGAIFILDA